MFLPIGDDSPRERTPIVNYALLALNIGVFLVLCFPRPTDRVVLTLALIPHDFSILTLFTSMFLHANFAHLAGNMLFLWIFGDNVEDKLGHFFYLLFYLAAGVVAAFLHMATTADVDVPMLGASGAISGVVAAYAVFFPHNRVRMLIWFYFYLDIVLVPAVIWIGIWFATQVALALFNLGGGVAYFAHIGGFAVGLAVAVAWKFLFFPLRFGHRIGEAPYPAELVAASRAEAWQPPVRKPFVTVVKEDVEFVGEGPHERFALLRMEDNLAHVGTIADIVQQESGLRSARTVDRLRSSRGVIARDLDAATSERIFLALRREGIRVLRLPDDRSSWPPPPANPDSFTWNQASIGYTRGDDVVRLPWSMPFLYLGTLIGARPVIDIFVTPRSRLRVTEETPLRFVDAQARTEQPATLRLLASAILEYRRGAALNDGIRVLASRGSWGWLSFREEADYEEYVFWVYNVILSRQALSRS